MKNNEEMKETLSELLTESSIDAMIAIDLNDAVIA